MDRFVIGNGFADWDTGGGFRYDGGAGSGNWGHAGVPGKRGGSAPGGGSANWYIGHGGKGYTSFAKEKKKLDTENLTNAIDKADVPVSTVMWHGVGEHGFSSLMKIPDISDKSLNSIIGKSGVDDGFVSCGTSEEKSFDKDVIIHIRVPKGAKGLYVEPFSYYGLGSKSSDWDGKITQTYVGSENETILQRGGEYYVTLWERYGGNTHAVINAYEKYLDEHPASKMSLEDFSDEYSD